MVDIIIVVFDVGSFFSEHEDLQAHTEWHICGPAWSTHGPPDPLRKVTWIWRGAGSEAEKCG